MKKLFKEKKFSDESQAIVDIAVEIIDDYESQGYKLSLRQLFYQLVSKNTIPNTEASYKRVGDIIADARMAGLADWDMIEDRNREMVMPPHWDSPADIMAAAASSYRIDKWATQPNYCEVMVEKQALEGVLEPVCRELDIAFTANKGYSSITMMYQAGERLAAEFRKRAERIDKLPEEFIGERAMNYNKWLLDEGYVEEDMPVRLNKKGIKAGLPRIVVFYLGDHDPSGIDMTRDVQDRLKTFSDFTPMNIVRLALNMSQIEELQPPENPAKMSDSRANDYVEKFGQSSWELDAVAPNALADIVRQAVIGVRDQALWDVAVQKEEVERSTLKKLSTTVNKAAEKARKKKE